MIYSVTGIIAAIEPYHIVIECGGIGYSIKTSMTTLAKLNQVGEKAKAYTYLHVREDILELYGFADSVELASFKMLISVSGVGPKAAIAILSDLTPEQFALCVATGDVKALTVAQGIGIKIAQRVVLELKDKVSKEQLASGISGGNAVNTSIKTGNAAEAISALEVLGYGRSDATRIITSLPADTSVEEMIKHGLKTLASKM